MNDIEEKRIKVVVTKDYSRLGRDNLFTEQLCEIWFPKHNCRYVAINDNIDTMYEDEYAPFKAVINSKYSKDISKKVHSSYLSIGANIFCNSDIQTFLKLFVINSEKNTKYSLVKM